jgi:hypothetical protein
LVLVGRDRLLGALNPLSWFKKAAP